MTPLATHEVSADTPTSQTDARTARAQGLRRLVDGTPVLQLVVLIIVFIIAATTISGFLSKSSIYSVLVLAAFLGIAAAGQTLVILIGGLDLSVASIISAADLVAPVLMGAHWSPGIAIPVVIIGGAAIGALNGFIVRRWRVSPLIVTLAMGGIVYGSRAGTDSGLKPGIMPEWLTRFSSPIGTTFGIGIPPVVIAWAVLAIVLGVVLHRTITGRRVYATGANQRAADLAGISTLRVWVGAFALSGAVAAATGVLLDGFISAASTGAGSPYMFTSLAAVVVGGTSLVGARGDYWRTVLGALILTLITTILIGHGAGEALEEAAYGFLILVFVGVYGRERRVRDQV
jgi:ribose transport system permease protein